LEAVLSDHIGIRASGFWKCHKSTSEAYQRLPELSLGRLSWRIGFGTKFLKFRSPQKQGSTLLEKLTSAPIRDKPNAHIGDGLSRTCTWITSSQLN